MTIAYPMKVKKDMSWKGCIAYNYTHMPGLLDFPILLNMHRAMMFQMVNKNTKKDGVADLVFPKTLYGRKLRTHQLFVLAGLVVKRTITWKNVFLPKVNVSHAYNGINVPRHETGGPNIPNNVSDLYPYISLVAYMWHFLLSSSPEFMDGDAGSSLTAYLSKIRPTKECQKQQLHQMQFYIFPFASVPKLATFNTNNFDELLEFLENELKRLNLIAAVPNQDVYTIPSAQAETLHTSLVNYFYRHILHQQPMSMIKYVAYVSPSYMREFLNNELTPSLYENYKFEDGQLIPPPQPPKHPHRPLWYPFQKTGEDERRRAPAKRTRKRKRVSFGGSSSSSSSSFSS
jgi:hypothetical protein